jgi:hypothetical protein
MLPAFDPLTGYLPSGVHPASWAETRARFGTNTHRNRLIDGLERALKNLAGAGCRSVILDGSFVSTKHKPKDYDAAWDPVAVDPNKLDPVLLDMKNGRAAMKMKYGGEFFPATAQATAGVRYREFFQSDRNGIVKGVVEIDLTTLP